MTPTALLKGLGRFTGTQLQGLVNDLLSARLQALFSIRKGSCKLGMGAPSEAPGLQSYFSSYFSGINEHFTDADIERFYPMLAESSLLLFDDDHYRDIDAEIFSPEEKGIATIASSAETVGGVFGDSFLEPVDIKRNLLKLHLLGIISFETALDRQERELESNLSDEQRTIKHAMQQIMSLVKHRVSFFDLLDIPPEISKGDFKTKTEQRLALFSEQNIKSLFMPEGQKEAQNTLIEIKKAIEILADDSKRNEYLDFIKSGGTGSFEGSSTTLRVEAAIKKAEPLFTNSKFVEAYNIIRPTLTDMPKNPVLLSWAGRILYQTGNQQEQAKKLIESAAKIDANCIEAPLFTGEIALHEKNSEAAAAFFKQALHIDPTHALAKNLLAKADPEGFARAEVDAMSDNLSNIDYYTLLGVNRTDKRGSLQTAFHRKTRAYHPDRFFTCTDEKLKKKAATLYKRTVEAYMVLRNPQKRQEYDRQLDQALAGQSGDVRLKDAGDVVQRKERSDIQIKHPNAKKFYSLALTCMNQKNFNGAIMNLKMALTAEPGNEWISKKLAEAEKGARGE